MNKYLLVCHVGSGPFPQKQSFPHAYIKAMCCHGNASSKASDGLILSPVGSVSTSLARLYEYNCDWDVFFSFSGTLLSRLVAKRAEYFTDHSTSQTVIGQPRSLTPIP